MTIIHRNDLGAAEALAFRAADLFRDSIVDGLNPGSTADAIAALADCAQTLAALVSELHQTRFALDRAEEAAASPMGGTQEPQAGGAGYGGSGEESRGSGRPLSASMDGPASDLEIAARQAANMVFTGQAKFTVGDWVRPKGRRALAGVVREVDYGFKNSVLVAWTDGVNSIWPMDDLEPAE